MVGKPARTAGQAGDRDKDSEVPRPPPPTPHPMALEVISSSFLVNS